MSLVLMNATVKYSTTTTTITKWKHDIKGNIRLISRIIIVIVVIFCSSLFLSCIVILFLGCVRLFVFAEYLCQFSSRSSRRVFDHFPAVRVRDDVRSVFLSVSLSVHSYHFFSNRFSLNWQFLLCYIASLYRFRNFNNGFLQEICLYAIVGRSVRRVCNIWPNIRASTVTV